MNDPAFCGQPLDRADPLRSDPARLASLRSDGRLLKLDALVPELDAEGRLTWEAVDGAEGELVFLGLGEGRAHFAAVPAEGNADPAYTQHQIRGMLGLFTPDDLALYGSARSVRTQSESSSSVLRLRVAQNAGVRCCGIFTGARLPPAGAFVFRSSAVAEM